MKNCFRFSLILTLVVLLLIPCHAWASDEPPTASGPKGGNIIIGHSEPVQTMDEPLMTENVSEDAGIEASTQKYDLESHSNTLDTGLIKETFFFDMKTIKNIMLGVCLTVYYVWYLIS